MKRRGTFEVFQGRPSKQGSWYWRFRAPNGRITFIGGEAFTRRDNAFRAVRTAKAAVRCSGYSPRVIEVTG